MGLLRGLCCAQHEFNNPQLHSFRLEAVYHDSKFAKLLLHALEVIDPRRDAELLGGPLAVGISPWRPRGHGERRGWIGEVADTARVMAGYRLSQRHSAISSLFLSVLWLCGSAVSTNGISGLQRQRRKPHEPARICHSLIERADDQGLFRDPLKEKGCG
jgi:hypothetical protein